MAHDTILGNETLKGSHLGIVCLGGFFSISKDNTKKKMILVFLPFYSYLHITGTVADMRQKTHQFEDDKTEG